MSSDGRVMASGTVEAVLPAGPHAGERVVQSPLSRRSTIATRRAKRDYLLHRAFALSDAVGLMLALSTALAVAPEEHRLLDALWLLPVLPGWLLIFKIYGLYDGDAKRISHHALDDVSGLFHSFVMGTLGLWLYFRVLPPGKLLFPQMLIFAGAGLVCLLALRTLARRLMRRVLGPERVLMLGANDAQSAALVRKIRAHPEYGLEPIGLISVAGDGGDCGLPIVGSHGDSDLSRLVEAHAIERLLVDSTAINEDDLIELVGQCRLLSLKLGILPGVSQALGPSVVIDEIEGVAVLGVNPPTLSPSSRLLKRSMDVLGSLLLLALAAPLMAVLALAIRLGSRGPALFAQERIGRGDRRFRLRKFRTMVTDAEAWREDLLEHSADPGWLKLEHDPRITRVGRFLRITSLDELPQLWSVLRGDMSLVGPRPLIESEDCQVTGLGRHRLDLTPGITGLWQVLGRTSIPFEEMVKLDYLYVTNWSLWGDLRLLLRTLPAVLLRRGAN